MQAFFNRKHQPSDAEIYADIARLLRNHSSNSLLIKRHPIVAFLRRSSHTREYPLSRERYEYMIGNLLIREHPSEFEPYYRETITSIIISNRYSFTEHEARCKPITTAIIGRKICEEINYFFSRYLSMSKGKQKEMAKEIFRDACDELHDLMYRSHHDPY